MCGLCRGAGVLGPGREPERCRGLHSNTCLRASCAPMEQTRERLVCSENLAACRETTCAKKEKVEYQVLAVEGEV